jgi:branched-chain amino acid transport system ATP-binding protein
MADPILSAEGVGVRFGAFQALSGMSIAVEPHTIHALIGPNGAGKTTFFNAITGMLRPDTGQIRLEGRLITRTTAHRRVQYGMARSFQVTNIYPELTVRENIRLAIQARDGREGWVFWRSPSARADIFDETSALLSQVGILDRADTRAGELSHGAQRLLEIGMALGANPKIICLDEPLAGMGIDDVHRTKALIVDLRKRMAVLLIEHNMSVVLSISDHITVMSQGRKIADGTADVIRNDASVRSAYLGSSA